MIVKYYQMVNYLIVFFLGVFLNTFVLVLLRNSWYYPLPLLFKLCLLICYYLPLTSSRTLLTNGSLVSTFVYYYVVGFLHFLAYTTVIVFGCLCLWSIVASLTFFVPFTYPKHCRKNNSVYPVSYSMAVGVYNSYCYAPRIAWLLYIYTTWIWMHCFRWL